MTVTFNRPRARRLAVLLAILPLAAACSSAVGSPSPSDAGSQSPAPPLVPVPSYTTGPTPSGCPSAQPTAMPAGQTSTVTLHTSMGDIAIKIEADLSPIAAGNFVALASCGYYNNTVFHRIAPSFVIQGGDGQYGRLPLDNYAAAHMGEGGPGYSIKDEPVKGDYTRGTVAMAKTNAANSAGSQFFIMLVDQPGLKDSGTFQIVGHVTSGMEVADKIATIANAGSEAGNVALQIVPVEWATVTTP